MDTGADFCTFPKSLPPWASVRVNYNLTAANGSTVNTYGYIILSLNLGLRRKFTWRFVVTDITKPIIGANFLAIFGILPDLKSYRSRTTDSITVLKVPYQLLLSNIISDIKELPVDSMRADTLKEFPILTKPEGICQPAKHNAAPYSYHTGTSCL